jgi:hypothetical protein
MRWLDFLPISNLPKLTQVLVVFKILYLTLKHITPWDFGGVFTPITHVAVALKIPWGKIL